MSDALRRAFDWHRPLMTFAILMAVTGLMSVGGLLFDDRILLGAPIWLKPFKFSVSIAVYAVTWAWMLSLQRRPRRWMHWTGTAVAVSLAVEMMIMITQVLRGSPSHFNVATPFDRSLWIIMGGSITAAWVLNLVQAVILMRDRVAEPATAWAVRFGILISLAGMAVAFLMTGPTPDQLDRLRASAAVSAIGAHAVGVPDGGPGMPITGWSLTGGDLRVPHFIGLHALQLLPLLALALLAVAGRRPRLRDAAVRARLVVIAAAAYAALLGVTTWQALRGQPVVAPDAWTLAALAAILAAALIATAVALRGAAPLPLPVPDPEKEPIA